MCSIVLVGGAALGAGIALPRLHEHAAARAALVAPTVLIDWPRRSGAEDATTWLDEGTQSELLTIVYDEFDRHSDPLGRAPLAAAGEALRRTGWFAQGPNVRRGAGGEVSVTGTWRVPAAVVRRDEIDRLVAWGGELLSREWSAGESRMPVVTGVRFDPPRNERGQPAYGEVWPGTDVQAGLELLALLLTEPYWDQIEGVDVASTGAAAGRERLVILTRAGTRVVFGARASNSGVEFGEVTTERKLWNLRQVFARYGRIDAGRNELMVHAELVIVEDAPRVGQVGAKP